MDNCKLSLLLIVANCLVFSMTSAAEKCSYANEDPLKGVLIDATKYPKAEIEKALASSRGMDQQITEDAKKWDIISSASDQISLPPTSSDPLCSSRFVQRFASGWYFIENSSIGTCWVLHHYWRYPLSYVLCRGGWCYNLPCSPIQMNYFCVATNYKLYYAWTWCTKGGFQYRKFTLPQCCECRRFNC